jgi:hypothetical protein
MELINHQPTELLASSGLLTESDIREFLDI